MVELENEVIAAAASKVKVPKSAGSAPKAKNPTYLQMVTLAIRTLKETKGSSRQAIQKYVIATYNLNPDVAIKKLNLTLRTGLKDGHLKNGKTTSTFKIGDKLIDEEKEKAKTLKLKAAKVQKAKDVVKKAVNTTVRKERKIKKSETENAAVDNGASAADPTPKVAKAPKVVKSTAKVKPAKSPAKKTPTKGATTSKSPAKSPAKKAAKTTKPAAKPKATVSATSKAVKTALAKKAASPAKAASKSPAKKVPAAKAAPVKPKPAAPAASKPAKAKKAPAAK